MPSPSQFNHVITVLPENGKYTWLDSTSEVAPFGLLTQNIRDEQGLVIPEKGPPVLMKTPADPPFASFSNVDVKSSLDERGTLKAHFDFKIFGDDSLVMRSVLHELAPSQWQAFAQQMSYGMSYAGDVSGVSVEDLEKIEKPLHYSYEYTRKDYSDWAGHKITPPIPPIGFGPGAEAEKPKEAFWAGAPGALVYRATVQLPNSFRADVPKDASASSAFADYSSHYSVNEGVLIAERRHDQKSKVTPEQWAEYQKFIKAVSDDQREYTVLTESSKPLSVSAADDNPPRANCFGKRWLLCLLRILTRHRMILPGPSASTPKQPGLWTIRAAIEETKGNREQAIADFRKNVNSYPDIISGVEALVELLVRANRWDDAIETARSAV